MKGNRKFSASSARTDRREVGFKFTNIPVHQKQDLTITGEPLSSHRYS